MIIKDDEVDKRLNNPSNLMNRLRSGSLGSKGQKNSQAMSLFIPRFEKKVPFSEVNPTEIKDSPSEETAIIPLSDKDDSNNDKLSSLSSSEIVDDLDEQVKLGLAHNKGLSVLTKALENLENRLDGDEPIKVDKIPAIISAASKAVEFIRKERLEKEKNQGKDAQVHFHFYCPQQKKVEEYEIIDVA